MNHDSQIASKQEETVSKIIILGSLLLLVGGVLYWVVFFRTINSIPDDLEAQARAQVQKEYADIRGSLEIEASALQSEREELQRRQQEFEQQQFEEEESRRLAEQRNRLAEEQRRIEMQRRRQEAATQIDPRDKMRNLVREKYEGFFNHNATDASPDREVCTLEVKPAWYRLSLEDRRGLAVEIGKEWKRLTHHSEPRLRLVNSEGEDAGEVQRGEVVIRD